MQILLSTKHHNTVRLSSLTLYKRIIFPPVSMTYSYTRGNLTRRTLKIHIFSTYMSMMLYAFSIIIDFSTALLFSLCAFTRITFNFYISTNSLFQAIQTFFSNIHLKTLSASTHHPVPNLLPHFQVFTIAALSFLVPKSGLVCQDCCNKI